MKRCPKCKLVSTDQAERCDCGFDFASGEVRRSYLPASTWESVPREVRAFALAVIGLATIGAILRGVLGEPSAVLVVAIWAPIVYYLALQFRARKRWARTALAMLTLPVGLLLFTGRYRSYLDSGEPGAAVSKGTTELREALLSRRDFERLPPDTPRDRLLCALMDWGVDSGVGTTLVAFEDGNVSLYLSNGGGFIGVGEHESVRLAGARFLAAVNEVRARFEPATGHHFPGAGEVAFWAVTADSTSSSGPVPVSLLPNEPLAPGEPPPFWLARAWDAAQATIARIGETHP